MGARAAYDTNLDLKAEILEIASGNSIFLPCNDKFKAFKSSLITYITKNASVKIQS